MSLDSGALCPLYCHICQKTNMKKIFCIWYFISSDEKNDKIIYEKRKKRTKQKSHMAKLIILP